MGQSATAKPPAHRHKQKPELTYVNEQRDPQISLQPDEEQPVRDHQAAERTEDSSPKEYYYLQFYKPLLQHEYIVLPSERQQEIGDNGLQYVCQQAWKIHTLSLGTSLLI